MTAVIAVWSVVAVLLGLHITRIRRQRSVPSLADEAERARILATPVEELADEIVRERERAAHVVRLPEMPRTNAVPEETSGE